MTNIIQKIIDNKSKITGIKLNGIFYEVSYVSVDDVDCFDQLAPNDIIVSAYLVDEYDCVLKYEFTVEEIKKANDVKLYKLSEV